MGRGVDRWTQGQHYWQHSLSHHLNLRPRSLPSPTMEYLAADSTRHLRFLLALVELFHTITHFLLVPSPDTSIKLSRRGLEGLCLAGWELPASELPVCLCFCLLPFPNGPGSLLLFCLVTKLGFCLQPASAHLSPWGPPSLSQHPPKVFLYSYYM